jgi:hypothetical protein
MPFTPFTTGDFQAMSGVTKSHQPAPLRQKVEHLRQALNGFPEFQLDFFRKRIVRRPMKGRQGVFRPPKWHDKHWFFHPAGGDQDEVQLNIGMFPDYLRAGLGFMIGRLAPNGFWGIGCEAWRATQA